METECIGTISNIKDRLKTILDHDYKLPVINYQGGSTCNACEIIYDIIDDITWYLSHSTRDNTKHLLIYQRTDGSKSCHHNLNPITNDQIWNPDPNKNRNVVIHMIGTTCVEDICNKLMEPIFGTACIDEIHKLYMAIDILLKHNELSVNDKSYHVCFCQLFNQLNLYLTRTEEYIKETSKNYSPKNELIKLLGTTSNCDKFNDNKLRYRNESGCLCYLSDGESIVTDPDEQMKYRQIFSNLYQGKLFNMIIIKSTVGEHTIYNVIDAFPGIYGCYPHENSKYDATEKKFLDPKTQKTYDDIINRKI